MKGVWRKTHFLLAFGSSLFLFLASVSGFILGIEALLDQTKPQAIDSLEDHSLKTTLEALDTNMKEVFEISISEKTMLLFRESRRMDLNTFMLIQRQV